MAFSISEGRIVDLYKPAAGGSFAPIRISDSHAETYAQLWKSQPAVRTVVGFLARNIAQLGIHVYRRVSDVDRERVTDHPLAELLSRPNPKTTPYRFIEAVVSDLAIYDNAFVLKVRPKDQAAGLVRLDPAQVTLEGKNPFTPDGYKVAKTVFSPEDVIHFRGYSPIDARQGISPLETLRTRLAEEYQATLYREQLWRNGARLSGYLQRPADAPEWSRTAKERFRSQWAAQYSGDGSQVGGTPILEDGMTYVPASVNPRDAQYIESRKLTREEVTAAYHVPLTLVGILDNATYSNITEQHKMMYQDTLGPWLTMIEQELMLQLVPDFAGSAEDLYVEFNLAEKLKGSFEEQAVQLSTAVGGPYMLRNEARARLNLPSLPEGEELITPLNVTQGGQASPQDSVPPPEGQTEITQGASVRPLRAVEGD